MTEASIFSSNLLKVSFISGAFPWYSHCVVRILFMFILCWLQFDYSARKSLFCLRSGPVNPSRVGLPQTALSASVWVLLCTGFLCGARNAQPGCEIRSMVMTHCSALVSIQPVCCIMTKKVRNYQNHTHPSVGNPKPKMQTQHLFLNKKRWDEAWVSHIFIMHGWKISQEVMTSVE